MTEYITPAESNEIGRKKAAKKAGTRRRNPRSAREFQGQVVVPIWLDRPHCKRMAAEWGCTEEQASQRLFKENY